MHTEIVVQNSIVTIKFFGRMDATNTNIYEETLEQCFHKNEKNIIVDFGNLEYISSAGLRSILIIEKQRSSHGVNIVFCSLQSMVQELFEISAFNSILRIFDNYDDARKSFE